MYYILINKNLVHQVGDQTKVILRCTVNQESRLDIIFNENPYVGSDLFHTDLKKKWYFLDVEIERKIILQ
jgi:hypothetical protein